MWLIELVFSSILQIWYVEVRISRSISESPLEFEITRVDSNSLFPNEVVTMPGRIYQTQHIKQDLSVATATIVLEGPASNQ